MKRNQSERHNPERPSFEGPSLKTFEKFYRDNYDAISRFVARRVSPESHDEVVSATFVVAWRKYSVVSKPSLPWLYRIASYEVAHEHRRVARHPVTVELNDLDLTDRHPLEDVIDLSTALGQLSENDVEMLRLLHWEGLGRSDAAEVLGCSVNTLNVRYHRAVAKLASTLHRFSNVSSSEIEVPKEHK